LPCSATNHGSVGAASIHLVSARQLIHRGITHEHHRTIQPPKPSHV
jgi:hypothetical protein